MSPSKHAFHGGAHLRNLANTTEPSMCDGNAAFLSHYFDHLLSNMPYFFLLRRVDSRRVSAVVSVHVTRCR